MSKLPKYVNPRTDSVWQVKTALWRAPDDGGYVNLTDGEGLTQDTIDVGLNSLWRYRKAIRLPSENIVSLGEGWTPIVHSEWAGHEVMFKMEYMMPSGSYKDRGSAVMMNYLKQVGIDSILEDSSGNAGSSIATYGAFLGLKSRIFVPANAPIAKRRQMAAVGADVVAVKGSRDDVSAAALKDAEKIFYACHNLQPYFLEGTKTLAFEIWEQLNFALPDVIVIPMGQGANVMGCHIGFSELKRAGVIDRLPRLYAVQAVNAAPYYAAWSVDSATPIAIDASHTIADGIASSKPIRLREVFMALRETDGDIVAVTEDEIEASLKALCQKGLFVEPTTAAGAAGLKILFEDGSIGHNEKVVLLLTGSGLKAVDTIAGALKL